MSREIEKLSKLATSLFGMLAAVVASLSITLKDVYKTNEIIILLLGIISSATAAYLSLYMIRRTKNNLIARRVFIIYARKDLEIARKISKNLSDNGFIPWLDVDNLLPGQIWKSEISEALSNSGAAIVIISNNLSESGYVREELEAAIKILSTNDRSITPIIPVKIDDSPPPQSLEGIHWVNLEEDGAYDKIIKGLEKATSSSRIFGANASK